MINEFCKYLIAIFQILRENFPNQRDYLMINEFGKIEDSFDKSFKYFTKF